MHRAARRITPLAVVLIAAAAPGLSGQERAAAGARFRWSAGPSTVPGTAGEWRIARGDSAAPSKPHVVLSYPAAAGVGLVGAALGLLAGYVLLDCEDEGRNCARGPDNGEYFLALAGLGVGSALGAHIGGVRRDSRGRLGPTLLAGAAVSGLFIAASASREEWSGGSAAVPLLIVPLATTLTDYALRQRRR